MTILQTDVFHIIIVELNDQLHHTVTVFLMRDIPVIVKGKQISRIQLRYNPHVHTHPDNVVRVPPLCPVVTRYHFLPLPVGFHQCLWL